MSLYTKDFLLDGKIIYFQLKKGYRSGIEPIILAAQCKKIHLSILDMGSGCGPISLICASRYPKSKIIGFEKNSAHLKLSNKSKDQNRFNNLEFFKKDVCQFDMNYQNYFDLILTNPPFFFKDEVITSQNKSIFDSRYISKKKLMIWLTNMVNYLKPNGRAFIINRQSNLETIIQTLRELKCKTIIFPICSFKGAKPKNVLIEVNKNEKYVEIIKNEIIIHTKSSKYSKEIENWFK